ncbi:AbrB/MazE/SpoVT family DNA-binding domain-containing protein [Blastomonas sp.]|uniref:AbrB/MazE/SpoVT family DNA-binding domain-containing protein n=1 Tax=Blastomonas sp. TaxID=1909299 RepID=UPI003593C5A9
MKPGKLTVKHQVTIPRDVRTALGLKAGDHVRFELRNGEAVITRDKSARTAADAEWVEMMKLAMPEWFSEEEDAYWADL